MTELLTWKDGITLALAMLGAALGVIGFSIEVVNLSAFAVTMTEVGFWTRGNKRIVVTNPRFLDGGAWPRRLEARQSVSVYFDPADVVDPRHPIGKAYARTMCGENRFGSSPALRQLRDIARRAS